MGKKRKFNRFIKWIKSDLPEEEKSSVLLLGVTKLSSPKLQRRPSNNSQHKNRPHTLHFDFATSSSNATGGGGGGTKQHPQRTSLNGEQFDVLKENSQNFSRKSSTPVTPSSVSSSKENISPFSSIKSSSFSGRASSPEGKLRTNSIPRNSISGVQQSKRVSFSDDTEDIIKSRDLARRNRDRRINQESVDPGDDVEINQRFIEDLPSVSYYNSYATVNNENVDERRGESPCVECRRKKSIDIIAKDEIGDILDVISDDLNIRPITRRNSSIDATKSTELREYFEALNEEDELQDTSVADDEIQAAGTTQNLDYNKNKYVETEKYYSENDIFNLFPKIATRRKLSTPITPAKSEDVDTFISEIIEELDIGPKLRRGSRPSASDSVLQLVATSDSSTSASVLPLDSSTTTPEEDDKGNGGGSVAVSEAKTSGSVNTRSPESPVNPSNITTLVNNKSVRDNSSDVVIDCLDLDEQSTAAMDRSVDSIGSCSLDVDMSTDFSDSSRGSISDCTLRSVSILTPPAVSNGAPPETTRNSIEPPPPSQNFLDEPIIKITDTDQQTTKKPSYLNLACCVNGYSNLTTYDSKLRESYRSGAPRSREVSPNRPGSALEHQTTTHHVYNGSYGQMTKGDTTSTTYLTPESAKYRITTSISSPSKLIKSPKMADTSTIKQNGGIQTQKDNFFSSTRSYLSKESRNFAASMLYDSTDGCALNKETKSYLINSPAKTTYSSYSSSTIIHSVSLSHQERYMNGATREYSSETSISTDATHISKVSPSKSFIQQRVERLYGPGALAQGFFIQTRQSPKKSETVVEKHVTKNRGDDVTDESTNISNSTPSLPVLRHLRPEFRAQLPILSPKRIINENGLQKNTTPPSIKKDYPPYQKERPKVNGEIKESKQLESEKIDVSKEILNESSTDSQESLPAAPKVVLPVISNGTDTQVLVNGGGEPMNGTLNGIKSEDETVSVTDEPVVKKDGHYFLKILKNESDRLLRLADEAENELETKMSELPDDALGYLRSASGKARLLVNQKMQQFEGLCHKNINQIPGEPFPTTAEDLQGFWDMVMIQINQVYDLFKDLDELRANNWVQQVQIKKPASETTPKSRKPLVKKSIPTQNTANSELQRTKRDAQRKLMLEQRRKAMAAKKNNQNGGDNGQNVEIFVPESTTS